VQGDNVLLDHFSYQFVDIANTSQGKTAHGQISQVGGHALLLKSASEPS
jgi:hypothetical protein